jgi:succinate dehydrogenase hydrophobic anchor subunit
MSPEVCTLYAGVTPSPMLDAITELETATLPVETLLQRTSAACNVPIITLHIVVFPLTDNDPSEKMEAADKLVFTRVLLSVLLSVLD